jgi:hypothetical protein
VSIEHLAATNRWIAELAEFKDLTAQMPSAPTRTSGVTPPPLRSGGLQSASE